jgi:hypothetical protein
MKTFVYLVSLIALLFAGGSNAWNDLPVTSTRTCYLVEYSGEDRPIPTLGQLGLLGLILLLGLLGWRATRQSRGRLNT